MRRLASALRRATELLDLMRGTGRAPDIEHAAELFAASAAGGGGMTPPPAGRPLFADDEARRRYRSCKSKRRYSSKAEATDAGIAVSAKYGPMRVSRCEYGRHWHLTSREKR